MNAFASLSDGALSSFASMLREARATTSKLEKQAIIKAALEGGHSFAIAGLLKYALSPYIRFGVAQIPDPIAGEISSLLADERLRRCTSLFDRLATRQVTGNAAKVEIGLLLGSLPIEEREVVFNILSKDLRAGFSESTVNKARPDTVPVFSCQLALSEMPDITRLSYPVLVEPKYDGVRCIAVKSAGVVSLFSRNGIPFDNFAEIEEALAAGMPDDYVFDGEVLHADRLGEVGFKLVMKRAKASRGKSDDIPLCYQAFDGMSLQDWSEQRCERIAEERGGWTRHLIETGFPAGGAVRATPFRKCYAAAEVEAYYAELVAAGFEGVIIKGVNGKYTFKRNASWLKLKPFDTVDLVVVGTTEGNGKYAGTLGTLVAEGHIGTSSGVVRVKTEVGSGFTDAQRGELWANRQLLVGMVVEVRYQDVTWADGSETY